MIDMQKVGTTWGYAPARTAYGTATPRPTGATGPTSITRPPDATTPAAGAGGPTIQAYQSQPAAPTGSNNPGPFGDELWTPQEWQDVGDYALAGMTNPYQQSEGLTKGMGYLDNMMESGGWGGSIDEYRAASDPIFAIQQKRIADQVKQAALMGGFNDSTMMTDRLSQRLGENMMGRESEFARMGVDLNEARRQRMMQGLGLYGQFGQQATGEYGDWADRGLRYAGLRGDVGDRYWRAPMEYASGTGEQAQGWENTLVTPEEQMYNDYFNVGNETQKYTPGTVSQLGGFLGDMGSAFGEDIWKWIK